VRHLLLLVSACSLAACSDSATAPEPDRLSLSVVSGDNQSGVVGHQLPSPLVVKVTQGSKAVSGALVNFVVVAPPGSAQVGSVYAGSALTNSKGIAQELWTLGPFVAIPNRVEARAVDPTTGQAINYGTFTATARPDVPAQGSCVFTSTYTGLPTTDHDLGAFFMDKYGNPVPNGLSVTFNVNNGTVTGASTTTGPPPSNAPSWSTIASGFAFPATISLPDPGSGVWWLSATVDGVQVDHACGGSQY
jgi:hypothetical protein